MSDLITPEELSALLDSIQVASGDARGEQVAATAALYDFRHAARLSPEDMRLLHGRLTTVAAVLGRTLSLYLGAPADLQVHSLDLASYEQYLRNLAPRPILALVSFGPGAAPALWELSMPVARVALDLMLGGSGQVEPTAPAQLPPLSRAVVGRLFQEVLSAWTELWPPLGALGPRLEGVLTTPDAVDTRAGDEHLFDVVMTAHLGGARGLLRLSLPLTALRRLLREEKETSRPAGCVVPPGPPAPSAPLGGTPVMARVLLEASPQPLAALAALQPGDVLDLRTAADTPFTLTLSGRPKFRVQPGTSAGRVAVKLVGAAASGQARHDTPHP